MRRLSVDCRISSASAALRKLPYSAEITAYRRCWKATIEGSLRIDRYLHSGSRIILDRLMLLNGQQHRQDTQNRVIFGGRLCSLLGRNVQVTCATEARSRYRPGAFI